MNIKDVYKKYIIPENLQFHMVSVANVIYLIKLHWTGLQIDWEHLFIASLLHDIGNIVKFDLSKPLLPNLNINDLKNIQEYFIKKYGKDDHLVTKEILKELSVPNDIVRNILDKSFGKTKEIANGENIPLKILAYADARVTPMGISSLEARIKDIKERMPKYTNRSDFPDLVEGLYIIEKQIQENVNIPLERISKMELKDKTSYYLSLLITN